MSALPQYDPEPLASRSVRVLNRENIADSAHRNQGRAIVRLENAERELAGAFAELETATANTLEVGGARSEPVWERLPLSSAALPVWMADRVGPAPIRGAE